MTTGVAAGQSTRMSVLVTMCRYSATEKVQYCDMLRLLDDIARAAAALQLTSLLIIMLSGTPGVYVHNEGFMYVSNNFCHQQFLAALFVLATVPTWALLACSVCRVESLGRRTLTLWLLSLPLPMGLGIVLFPICSSVGMHYVYVNGFVFTVGVVHLVVAYSSDDVAFIRTYPAVVVGTALCGAIFMTFALMERGPGTLRNIATIAEYTAVLGFVYINSLSCDRIREHVRVTHQQSRTPR
jgi:hypothetical protein